MGWVPTLTNCYLSLQGYDLSGWDSDDHRLHPGRLHHAGIRRLLLCGRQPQHRGPAGVSSQQQLHGLSEGGTEPQSFIKGLTNVYTSDRVHVYQFAQFLLPVSRDVHMSFQNKSVDLQSSFIFLFYDDGHFTPHQ